MKTRFAAVCAFLTVMAGLLVPLPVFATVVSMNDYSITPPFIQETIKPNMLFMIDNSASMYDLSNVDEGRKTCSSSGTSCTKDSDCPGGETCSTFLRRPYYCYDQSYRSSNTYVGNFDSAKLYRYSATNGQFEEEGSAFSCTAGSGEEAKSISGALCVIYSSTAPYSVSKFLASGNYLNWLTASKFDVEKRILTGGK